MSTVGAAVRMWRTKQSERRATIASDSPLTDIPNYASEIEQQAFSRIKQWKNSFALKLNNVLGERFQEMVAKKEEESSRKKKPKVLNVPMNLSDQEIGQLRNKILLELKQKLMGATVMKSFHPRFPFRELNLKEKHQLVRTLQI